jgi:hypothetical protein
MLTYNTYLFCLLRLHIFNKIPNSAYFLYFFIDGHDFMFSDDLFLDERLREWGGGIGGGLFQSAIYVNTNFYIKGLVSKFYEGLTDIIFFSLSKGFFDIILLRIFAKQGKIRGRKPRKNVVFSFAPQAGETTFCLTFFQIYVPPTEMSISHQ